MKEGNKPQRSKFSLLYKLIKENAEIPFTPEQFIEKAKIFSIPIINRILLLFTIIKLIITYFYFIIFEKTVLNLTIISSIILAILCFITLILKQIAQYKIFSFINVVDSYVATRILRVTYIIIFIYEENHTIFNYAHFTFQLNPGFIFFMLLSLLFFESNDFHGGLFYLYILNIVGFVCFFSLENCLNFYMPINIVIGMFILISVVAHNIGKKLSKSETFFRFYERILEGICKEQEIAIAYDNHIIFPREEKITSTVNNSNTSAGKRKASIKMFDDFMESQSETSFLEQDTINIISEKENKMVSVADFEGFNLVFTSNPMNNLNSVFNERKQSDVGINSLTGFLNLILFLKETNETKGVDLSDFEEYFDANLRCIKSKIFYAEIIRTYSIMILKDRIIALLIDLIIESVCEGAKMNVDEDCLKKVVLAPFKENNSKRIKISLKFKQVLNMKTFYCIKNIIKDVCNTFNYNIKEDDNQKLNSSLSINLVPVI